MKTLAERLKYAMEVLPPKKIKGVELARAVGVKPPSVSDWLTGKSQNMEGPNLIKAAKFLKVNSAWLGTGVGKPLDKEKEADSSNIEFARLELKKIPVLDFVQAGMWKEVAYDGLIPLSYTYTDYDGSNPDAIFSVVVTGNSMEPDFIQGDKLIIDAALMAKPGCYVIARNGTNEATFKKYKVTGYDEFGREQFELVPLNDDYPKLSSKNHDITIIGVMVRHMRDYKY
ncbi:LexA family protein [Acinetobacter sp. WCHAc060025]|uniref:LexA family protein n=1 Tax=Acinetobacter sp. WCHAc060025 TaxID=2518625 RepID=UPI0010237D0B|nr:S24 family peptidase [Acinetobacter sp. WCHAc060025]RZG72438.1 helix-turn-helix domain-containing protein [Acinetobacter sp. WCHAc060025]